MGDAETGSLDDGRVTFEPRQEEKEEQPRVRTRDPVCGIDVDPAGAAAHSQYRGVDYYFCSKPCKQAFDEAPVPYVGR